MDHISQFKFISKMKLSSFILTGILSITGCAKNGSQGSASFTPTISITGAICSSDSSTITLTVQNNAPYAANIYTMNPSIMPPFSDPSVFYGIICTSGVNFWTLPDSTQIFISANGTATIGLDNSVCSTFFGVPCIGATPSTQLQCGVAPYPDSSAPASSTFAISLQLLTC